MTMICVPILVDATGDVSTAIARATDAVAGGARLVEWRVDAMATEPAAPAAIVRLVRDSPAPCLLTCRAMDEGGVYEGGGDERIAMLIALERAEVFPKYIDIEQATWTNSAPLRTRVRAFLDASRQGEHRRTGLILSMHDFSGRPRDLLQRLTMMYEEPDVNVVKIVWHGRSLRDNLEAFELLRERRKPMIALIMGEFGLMSRVLAPKFGGLLTFAAADTGGESAPGQPTIRTLLDQYRFDDVNADTRVFGVIGWPVAHSASPAFHNHWFAEHASDDRSNAVYLPLPVPDDDLHFKATVGALLDEPTLHFRGASVTIPHKAYAMTFVRERGGTVDDLAARIGAINTFVHDENGRLRAMNTDAPAILACITELRNTPRALSSYKIAVLGAGGAARAAIGALAYEGAEVVVFNRTQERAADVIAAHRHNAMRDGAPVRLSLGTPDQLANESFDVYINTTSIGMTGGPEPDANVIDVLTDGRAQTVLARMSSSTVVFDTVYAPPETPLLAAARRAGALVITGRDMFERQARLQTEIWSTVLAVTRS
jgi:3-dehydroquinate dehydratase/shikimate dehydrogenase